MDKAKFSQRVKEDANGCWIWQKSKDKKGYGRSTNGALAHRIAFELFKGPVPEGLSVLHRCDVPSCVNPDHLFVGTSKDNTEDCVSKGRHWYQKLSTEEKSSKYRVAAARIPLEKRVARSRKAAAAMYAKMSAEERSERARHASLARHRKGA